MKNFIAKYSVSKTLRFELKPIGKTLENIQKNGLISKDEMLAENYKEMKKTIDEFHKEFIHKTLSNASLDKENLKEIAELYTAPAEKRKEDNYKNQLKAYQKALRKEIVDHFKNDELFKNLFAEKLIKNHLQGFAQQKGLRFYSEFNNFTTYFVGFHENRKNIYTDEDKRTSIAYRLIHENLPKFIHNIAVFEKIQEKKIPLTILENQFMSKLGNDTLADVFRLEYYNCLLTQNSIDFINQLIGGYVNENQEKIQGLNEYINLYNQQQKDKKDRLPKMKMLYKQILSDRESISFLPQSFKESQEVLDAIRDYYLSNLLEYRAEDKEEPENVLEKIQERLSHIADYDLSKIYIRNDKAITDISQTIFGHWGLIHSALEFDFRQKNVGKKTTQKQEEDVEKYLKSDYYSIAEIENALISYKESTQNEKLVEVFNKTSHPIADYFKTYFKAKEKSKEGKEYTLIANIQAKYTCVEGLLNTDYPKDKKLHTDKDNLRNLKAFLDAILELLHFVKPLIISKNDFLEKDENFYSSIEPYYKQLELLIPLYNKVRNFATQKPYSTEKIKLNFENSTLLNGWDKNKESDNTCVLFRKGEDFYLGIMNKKYNKIFENVPKPKSDTTFLKMEYKLLPGANKMLPKVFFSKKNIAYYAPDSEILRIRNHSTHTKDGEPQKGYEKQAFKLEDCHKMIDFFKSSIEKHPEWKNFNFTFSNTQSYQSIDEFYREVEEQGYSISFVEVDEEYINQCVNEGKLYLFQIYNKDFSKNKKSKGKPNLHTLYWKALFDPENLKDVIYKLNGEAEVFYRKKSISAENIIVHKAQKPIENKNPLNLTKYSIFQYDIIKDRHYTEDKFLFHVPITLNFKSKKGKENINQEVLDYLKENPDVNIIGIDRGERHLLYLTVINSKGQILHQESLNTLKNETYNIQTDYHALLHEKEKDRDKARKEWGVIENIKELKEGYLSAIIHNIAKLMVQYNAIVVMEDLNSGFKRGRIKVEKQVYQKFEKMLIEKLNYLVFKDVPNYEPGGLYNALQLTSKFESFEKLGKQSGFLFYIPAWNTSKIDPTTGFVNLFGGIKYESIHQAVNFFEKFQSIRYNTKEAYFEFAFDYNDFTTKAEGTKTQWTVCTHGERIINFRNTEKNSEWDSKTVQLTQQIKNLLNEYHIAYEQGQDIKPAITAQNDKKFFEELLKQFKNTLQMRNSVINSDVDYLISPVMNAKGEFFDTRKTDSTLPQNADANGAYHIAKKGLLHVQQIIDGVKKTDLTNKKWLKFVQNNL